MSLRPIRPRSTKGSMSRAHAQRSQSRNLPRRGEKEREVSDATASRWDWSQSQLFAEFEKKPCVAIAFGKRVHRDEDGAHASGVHRNPDVVDLSRILVLLDLRLKIAAHSVNKWRRERVCGHGFYFSPTEDARLARLRRGSFFTSVRCAIFSTVPRRRYSSRISSSISSRRS